MKHLSFGILALVIMTFSSCYVGVEGGHHRRHSARIEIRASNDINKKDSLQSPALSNIDQKDSLQSPVDPALAK